jgi:hypothetical protein
MYRCHVLWRGRYVTSCCVIKMLCDDHVMWQIALCDGSRYVTCHVIWRSCCVTLTLCDIMFGAITLWNCHVMWQSRRVTSRYVAAPRWMGTCLFTTHLNEYMSIRHPPECCPRGWDEWIHVYSPRGHSFRYSANHWIGWTPSLTIHTYVRDVHERISILSQIRVCRKKIYEI